VSVGCPVAAAIVLVSQLRSGSDGQAYPEFPAGRRGRPPEMPGFIKPQLATLKSKAPVGSQWLHEIKFDGYRVQVHINVGRKKVTREDEKDDRRRISQAENW
jgi:ATP-dependent DNA ligase